MSKTTPAQQFGYLELYNTENKKTVLIKANQITAITPNDSGTFIEISNLDFYVSQTVDQIIDQLECIHPSLR